MLNLSTVTKSNPLLRLNMAKHYSHPKGFVGRSICYAVLWDGCLYGHIVGGSATRFLPGRNKFFGSEFSLNIVINNIFYHIEKVNDKYPCRNFAETVLKFFRERVAVDWEAKYGDPVIGFESLVELPRPGTIYLRDGWTYVGTTIGYTCKRVAGKGTDSWTGKRVWNTTDLYPKLVFCKKI
jgi:hypothetical protein